MKNIKNYKMNEINFKENFEKARLYSTNQPNACHCGCVGCYRELSFDEAVALLPENNNFKVFNMDEANNANYRVPTGKGYYYDTRICVKLGSYQNPENPLHRWKSRKLIIELKQDVEKSLY